MGLFDMFKKKADAAPAGPASVTAQEAADIVCAPVTGRVIKMTDVPDPVFSGEVVGKGCAIWPDDETVYSPVSGTVTVTMGHAVGITGDNGIEVLVHIGIDTVDMEEGRPARHQDEQGRHRRGRSSRLRRVRRFQLGLLRRCRADRRRRVDRDRWRFGAQDHEVAFFRLVQAGGMRKRAARFSLDMRHPNTRRTR